MRTLAVLVALGYSSRPFGADLRAVLGDRVVAAKPTVVGSGGRATSLRMHRLAAEFFQLQPLHFKRVQDFPLFTDTLAGLCKCIRVFAVKVWLA